MRTSFIVLLLFATSALAQEGGYKPPPLDLSQDYTAQPYYEMQAQQALTKPPNFRFMGFRSYYAMTRQYDPFGKTTREKLLNIAYDMQNNPDPGQRQAASTEYARLLVDHLANIDVVTQALALSRQDRRFGDPEFLAWMRAGLIQSIEDSGDGRTLAGAYDALTLGEEDALFQALGLRVLSTDARESARVYYNMHEVEDPETGKTYTVFVDISIPMRHLARLEAEKPKNFNIGPR